MVEQTTDLDENMRRNWGWQKQFLPQAQEILYQFFGETRVGTPYEDSKLGADLLTTDGNITIGVRHRHPSARRYADITVRSEHSKSSRCELDKLLEGKPDFWFYCYADNNQGILSYYLINCKFLAAFILNPAAKKFIGRKSNDSGETHFITVPLIKLQELYPFAIMYQGDV